MTFKNIHVFEHTQTPFLLQRPNMNLRNIQARRQAWAVQRWFLEDKSSRACTGLNTTSFECGFSVKRRSGILN